MVGADAARPAASAEVFAALRGEDDGSRSEPLLAIVFLAGIAGVLGTNAFSHALDDFELDGLTLAVVAFISGGLYGLVGYFLLGFLAYAGARAAGSDVSFGRARQIVGFAVVPLALSLLVWFLRIAIYGGDPFRTGGSDTGFGNHLFEAVEVAALVWSGVLLVVGLRAYHGWSIARALAAAAPALALPALGCGQRAALAVFDVVGDGRDLGVAEAVAERRHAAAAVADLLRDLVLAQVDAVELRADRALRVRGPERVAAAAAGRRKDGGTVGVLAALGLGCLRSWRLRSSRASVAVSSVVWVSAAAGESSSSALPRPTRNPASAATKSNPTTASTSAPSAAGPAQLFCLGGTDIEVGR